MTAIALFLLLVAALALAAFCAGAETGFLSLNRGRITHLAREGSTAAKAVAKALSDMPRTMTTLLIGNNLGTVLFSCASAELSGIVFSGSAAGRTVWSVFAALAMLYAGEFMPKLFCTARPLRRMLSLSKPWSVLSAVLGPVAAIVDKALDAFIVRSAPKDRVTTSDLLRILEDRKDGVRLTDFESALISRILVLRKKGREVTVEELLKALDDE